MITPTAAGVLTVTRQSGAEVARYSGGESRYRHDKELFGSAIRLGGRFNLVAKRHGLTITELAYRYILSTPGVTTIVGGFSDVYQLEECVRAAEGGALPEEILEAIAEEWAR